MRVPKVSKYNLHPESKGYTAKVPKARKEELAWFLTGKATIPGLGSQDQRSRHIVSAPRPLCSGMRFRAIFQPR